MQSLDLVALIELAKLKREKPDEYKQTLHEIKEVAKDILTMAVELMEEVEAQSEDKKRKYREDKEDLKIAEKMRRYKEELDEKMKRTEKRRKDEEDRKKNDSRTL